MTPPWCETVRPSVAVGLSSRKLVQARVYRLSCLDGEKWQRCSSLRCDGRPLSIFLCDPSRLCLHGVVKGRRDELW